jgi:transcription elongation factor Elf1
MWSSCILAPEEPVGDIVPTISRKPGIKVCPRCGSMDVDATTGTGYVSPPLYVCNRCNFSGTIFPEVENVEALKELKRSAEVQGESPDAYDESQAREADKKEDKEDMD